jgi:hypothetical protein
MIKENSILIKGTDQKTGKTMYLYNIRIIGQMFEERREQMLNDNTTNTLFSWIGDVCSLYKIIIISNSYDKDWFIILLSYASIILVM